MNQGFFDLPKTNQQVKIPKGATGCEACGLCHQVHSPKMPMTGEGKLRAFILGEGPGSEEDRRNKQFVGQSGELLRKHLRIRGFDLDRDFFKQNAVACRPTTEKGSNRTPTSKEIQYCEFNWRADLEKAQPKFIFLFGAKAVEAFFMHRTRPITTNLSMARWRKLCIPDPQTKAWVMPLYHPAFVERNEEAEPTFKIDLKWALEQLNRPSPIFPDYDSKIVALTQFDLVVELLKKIFRGKLCIAFDYETSSLRPYLPGNKVWSISLRIYGEDLAYSFPYSYPGHWTDEQFRTIEGIWKDILSEPLIPKMAQSMSMEHIWSKIVIGQEPKGWLHDTMLCSHVLDGRQEYTGLDFQTFINFGYEYGSEIEPYKKLAPYSNFNSMDKCPLPKLLDYGGKDSWFTMELAYKQFDYLKDKVKLQQAYDLFHEGELSLSAAEETGINVDVKYFQDTKIQLEKRLKFVVNRIHQSPENKLFLSKTGRNIVEYKDDRLYTSTDDLKDLLYRYMELKPTKVTERGNTSLDQTVLEGLDLPFAKDIVKVRQISKLKTTYVDGILRLQVDGRIHPEFPLHLVRTYRSSSSNPNFHNLPKRDKYSMALIRGGIIPSPGNCIIEADYGGHEIRIATCYSKDSVMIKELEDKFDTHKYWGDQLRVSRFDGKNAFVFAEIYGSYYKAIWKNLVSRGYNNLTMLHVQKVEAEFWRRYKATKKFQESLFEFYKNNGYIEMLTGFRCEGFLTRNEIVNYPVQGTAFHLLLWSLNQLTRISKEEGWISKIIGEIHDSILIDACLLEVDHIVQVVKRVMTQDIVKAFPWIIVPLLSEITVTNVDRPWHTKEEYE